MKLLVQVLIGVLVGSMLLALLVGPASAAGSDSPTPYTVDATGITLPDGHMFSDSGHVNVKTDEGDVSMHFEGKCITRTDAECAGKRHADAQFIGKSFIPWSAFGLPEYFCVLWVQIHGFNEHFGEGGQEPVCMVGAVPSPSPSPEPSPLPSTTPEPSATPTPVPELAHTGLAPWQSWALLLLAGALVSAGCAIGLERARRREVAELTPQFKRTGL